MCPRTFRYYSTKRSSRVFDARVTGEGEVQIRLPFGANVVFAALRNSDLIIEFEGTDSHTHPDLLGLNGDAVPTASDILAALAVGELVVVTRTGTQGLQERWLHLRREPLVLFGIEDGDVFTVNVATIPGHG